MNVIMIIILIFLLPISIGMLIFTLRDNQLIFFGVKNTLGNRIRNAALLGISGSILFFCIIIIAGVFFEKDYSWSFDTIFMSIMISISIGVFIGLGLLWQFFIVCKYRTNVVPKIIEHTKKDKK